MTADHGYEPHSEPGLAAPARAWAAALLGLLLVRSFGVAAALALALIAAAVMFSVG